MAGRKQYDSWLWYSQQGSVNLRNWISYIWDHEDLWDPSLIAYAQLHEGWEPGDSISIRAMATWMTAAFDEVAGSSPSVSGIEENESRVRRLMRGTSEPPTSWQFGDIAVIARVGMLFAPGAAKKSRDERWRSVTLPWLWSVFALESNPVAQYRALYGGAVETPELDRLTGYVVAAGFDPNDVESVIDFSNRYRLTAEQVSLIQGILLGDEPSLHSPTYMVTIARLGGIYSAIDPGFDQGAFINWAVARSQSRSPS